MEKPPNQCGKSRSKQRFDEEEATRQKNTRIQRLQREGRKGQAPAAQPRQPGPRRIQQK